MRRPSYLLSLLWLFLCNVISFCLTLAFIACLALAWQGPRLERFVDSFLASTPETRGAIIARNLEKNALVAQASVGSLLIEGEGAGAVAATAGVSAGGAGKGLLLAGKGLLLKDISIETFAKISISCESLKIDWLAHEAGEFWHWHERLADLSTLLFPSNVNVDGLRVFVPRVFVARTLVPFGRRSPHTAYGPSANDNPAGRGFPIRDLEWRSLARLLDSLALVINDRGVVLKDSELVLQRGDATSDPLRLHFGEIIFEGRNGLTWRGEGIARGLGNDTGERGGGGNRTDSRAGNRTDFRVGLRVGLRVSLEGNYAPPSARLYQSLNIAGLSPQQVLGILAPSSGERGRVDSAGQNGQARDWQARDWQARDWQARNWLARKGELKFNYSHDLDDEKSRLKLNFAQTSRAPTLAFTHSYDRRLGDWSNSNLTFNDLPLEFVWFATGLLSTRFADGQFSPASLPFELSGQAFGYLNLRQSQKLDTSSTSSTSPPSFDGELKLVSPSLQWRGEASAVDLQQAKFALTSTGGTINIDASIDVLGKGDAGKGDAGKGDAGKGDAGKGDAGKGDAGMDATIELTPQAAPASSAEESSAASRSYPFAAPPNAPSASSQDLATDSATDIQALFSQMQLQLQGDSRASIDVETVLGLWPPGFKSKARKVVIDVARGGRVHELKISLASSLDLAAKKARLGKLDGSFHLQSGRLRVFAKPLTFRDVSSFATFEKNLITFDISSGRYRDNSLVTSGEVSFGRRKDLLGKNRVFMDASIEGTGAAEDLRFLIRRAPFLQRLTFLQRAARFVPPSPSALGKGSFNLRAFTKQLKFIESGDASDTSTDILFPQPLYYDTAWDFERVRFAAPFLRFYEGEAKVASSSSTPLDLSLNLSSSGGNELTLSWHNAISDGTVMRPSLDEVSEERIDLSGTLDAAALARDFGYLPSAWFVADIPLLFGYRNHSLSPARANLSFGTGAGRMRVGSEYLGGSKGLRVFGGSIDADKNAKSWKIEGNYNPEGYSSLLLRQLQPTPSLVANTSTSNSNSPPGHSQEPFSILLQNDATSNDADGSGLQLPVWRLLASGETLDLSSWVAEQPWQALRAADDDWGSSSELETDLPMSSYINLDLAIRLASLRLYRNEDSSSSTTSTATSVVASVSSSEFLENVQSDFAWRGGVLRGATFSSSGDTFVASATGKRNKKKGKAQKASTNILYDLRDDEELLLLESDDLGSFLHQIHGVGFAEGGKAEVLFSRSHRPDQRPKPRFIGYGKVDDISLYDMPLLFKLWDSIGLVGVFSKGVRRLNVSSDLSLWDGVLSLDNFKLANNLTALTARGSVDVDAKKIDLRGEVASLPIVSNFLRSIPILGYVLVGRKRNNLFAFSYNAEGDWSSPKVEASPISFLLPGIVKVANPLQFLESDEIRQAQQLERDDIARREKERKDDKAKQKSESGRGGEQIESN